MSQHPQHPNALYFELKQFFKELLISMYSNGVLKHKMTRTKEKQI